MANLRVDKITSTETFETTGSVQFDGSGDYLSLGSSTDFDFGTGNFTIEGFFYTNASTVYQALVVSKNYYTVGYNGNWVLRRSDASNIAFASYNGQASEEYVEFAAPTALNTWYHFALVREGTGSNQTKFYLNGSLAGTMTVSKSLTDGGNGIYIGDDVAGPNGAISGHISNVRILKGTALYTKNFTPPTRELTVIPNTVLLCCQSTTRANEERTGKTITVNGNAVANELTPGLLTDRVKSGGSSSISGSVEFDGDGDYLSLADASGVTVGTGDFTIEYWINLATSRTPSVWWASGTSSVLISDTGADEAVIGSSTDTASGYSKLIDASSSLAANTWGHVAVVRSSGTTTIYLNGVSGGNTTSITGSFDCAYIGRQKSYTPRDINGFISNLRIVKGTALYTSNFIPPTRELKKVPGTVLLCCQDENSVTTEATGKTITSNGDPAASNFTPQVGNDGSVEFVGPIKINTENYFYLPTGDTESRGRGRGVIMGGSRHTAPTNPDVNTIFYIDIATQGNAVNFGELISVGGQNACVASSTRGISAGGNPSTPAYSNIIEFVTIATTSNATDFGDLTAGRFAPRGMSSSTRGLFAGGRTPTYANTIDYITMASTGDAIDFGDLNIAVHAGMTGSSPTRGIHAGGQPESSPFVVNIIDFVTIASTGNATDFGDLSTDRKNGGSSSSSTRMVMGGGTNPALLQSIEYLTIPSKGSSVSFGNLTGSEGRWGMSGMSNSIRGVFCGGYDPSPSTTSLNTIDFVTIASTGNAQDFGDVNGSSGLFFGQSCSDSHGGLG